MNDWVGSQDAVISWNVSCILFVWFFRVQKLHQRWVALRSLLHSKLITPLASISFPVEERTVTRQTRTVLETRLVETNIHFRQLQECTEWCRKKLVSYFLVSTCILLPWIWLLIDMYMYIPRTWIESWTLLFTCDCSHCFTVGLHPRVHSIFADILKIHWAVILFPQFWFCD
jgi:hypothetical protein